MSSLGEKATSGLAWSAVEKFSTSGINFVFNILIARILLPSDYGLVAMLGIFLSVCNCFIDSGFSSALIRKLDRDEDDFCTVFYFNLALAVLCYAALFFCAPLIADFYDIPDLARVTRLVGLNLLIGSISSIQNVKLSVDINFRTRAIISLAAVACSGVTGYILAKKGFGVDALVWQGISLTTVKTILFWFMVGWRPSLRFSGKSLKEMFGFGSRLLVSNLIDTIYTNVYTLVIGKKFSADRLGFYSKADNLAQFPSAGMSGVIQSVSYPALSRLQNDRDRLRGAFSKFIRMSSFVVFPMMLGMVAVAEPFIRVLLTDKWADSVIFLRLICLAYIQWPIHVLDMNLLNVVGRSDYYLRAEILRKSCGIAMLCVTVPFGIEAMCIGQIVGSVINLLILTHFTNKALGYTLLDQLRDMYRPFLMSAVMSAAAYLATSLTGGRLVSLVVGIVLGVAVYVVLALVSGASELKELLYAVKKLVRR